MIWSPGQLERRCWSIWGNSSARQALEGAAIAPGSNQTLTMLSDPAKRPPVLRDPIPDEVLHHVPGSLFELDEDSLLKNLRSARRGAAGGPSGMTVEHLCILLDNTRDSKLFFRACEQMAQVKVPDPIIAAIRVGRMTALFVDLSPARWHSSWEKQSKQPQPPTSMRCQRVLVASVSHIPCKGFTRDGPHMHSTLH